MRKILVTGANGQLGQCLKALLSQNNSTASFIFNGSSDLNITDFSQVMKYFEQEQFDFCINCAAYTNVDKAETDLDKATEVNVLGAQNLAKACQKTGTTLLHISTDFVFDGTKRSPYLETDTTAALGVYGSTKEQGENEIIEQLKAHYIIRTSWLYSEYGHNFMKTMLRLASEKESLSVVSDQIGTPTYAKDLAEVLLKIITQKPIPYGIYHYSNEGEASWFDFAQAIFDKSESQIQLSAMASADYPQAAQRPGYSVMDKSKLKNALSITIPDWEDSLSVALAAYKVL